MATLKDRPTADLIVIFLTGLIGLVVVVVLIGAIVLKSLGKDPGDGLTWVARITSTMVGSIFGYLAGRSVPTNGNGKKETP